MLNHCIKFTKKLKRATYLCPGMLFSNQHSYAKYSFRQFINFFIGIFFCFISFAINSFPKCECITQSNTKQFSTLSESHIFCAISYSIVYGHAWEVTFALPLCTDDYTMMKIIKGFFVSFLFCSANQTIKTTKHVF